MTQKQEFDLIREAGKEELHYWRDIWRYRELFFFFAWRDILVRYKQTIVGIAWCLLRPAIATLILTFIFSKLANLPSLDMPYPILVFSGMLPWQFFSTSLNDAAGSVVGSASMITKIYFPRIIIPISTVIVNLVDLAISVVILIFLMMWYSYLPSWKIIFMPFFIMIAVILSFGFGLWFASLNVKYRDIRYVIPFAVQIGMYISPIGFSSAIVPDSWKLAYSINPLVGVIDGCRWAISGNSAQLYWQSIAISVLSSCILLVLSVLYFRKTEKYFADVI